MANKFIFVKADSGTGTDMSVLTDDAQDDDYLI